MPTRSKRPCGHPGCAELVDYGRCAKHLVEHLKQHERQRGSSTARGYGSDWQQLSARHKQQHPLCVACLKTGRTTAVEEVDHIIPFRGVNDPLRLDPNNLQSLCGACHRAKTARQNA